ncbi:hypothetical protein ACJMK2_038679 [Sinanodonta woodiana]|uniref:C2H2-type domain-containing protein n=1 Tax=Sinanodonta woodiana TaxID=1069815 RepID=A0ABD3WAK6_SINWO
MPENEHEQTGKEIMDTKEWTEMTMDNVADIVYVAAENLNYFGNDSIQTSKELGTINNMQGKSDTLFDSGLSSNRYEDLCLSANGNYKSKKRKAACIKPEVCNDINFNTTSASQSCSENRPTDALVPYSRKEQAMSKIVSNRILNKDSGGVIRKEICGNSKTPAEKGQESIIATATFHTSSHSVAESSKDNKKDNEENVLDDEGMKVDTPRVLKKDAKMKNERKICHICNKVLSTSYSLKKHVKTHARNRLFSCRGCGSKFKTLNSLKSHARIHVERKIYECAHCGEKFTTKNYLVSVHLPKHTDTNLNKYQFSCSVCNRKFMSKYGFQMHIKLHIDEKSYACEICGKAFMSVSGLTHHTNTHTGKDMYACDHCGRSFPRFADLEKHIRTHTGERPFQCKECDRTYKTYGDLAVHMRKHNPDPRFKCDICGKFCLQSRDLLNHKVIKHGTCATKEKIKYNIKLPCECEICGHICSNRSNYNRHKRKHHSIQNE